MCQPGWWGWGGGGRGGTGTCVRVAESLPCAPETITILLIGYIPIQDVFGVEKNKKI